MPMVIKGRMESGFVRMEGARDTFEHIGGIDREAIFQTLEREGIVCIRSAVPEPELRQLREAVSGLLSARGSRSFSLVQAWKTVPAFAVLVQSAALLALLRNLALRAWNTQSVEKSEVYNVLRVITGPVPDRERPLLFHYDRTVVTALVPIFVPDGDAEEAGDFVCFPNFRPVRRSVWLNLIEKLVMQNPLTRSYFARKAKRPNSPATIVKLVPGNIYLFWGYRTYHGNFSCGPNALRATLLLHFGDPHLGSIVTRSILATREWRVDRSSKLRQIDVPNAAQR